MVQLFPAATSTLTQINATLTIATDTTSRDTVLKDRISPSSVAMATASQLVVSAVGDVNRDGFEDLVFGDASYAARVGGTADQMMGRVYLVLGRQSSSGLVHNLCCQAVRPQSEALAFTAG